jgi:ribosomal protein S18 acetylase RimI-like enzyme
MTVRTATGDDVDAIRAVADRSWTTDYPDILTRETAEDAVNEWYAPESVATELRDSRTLVLVAEREGDVAGFAHATWTDADREGYLLRLYVDPDHRRERVGRELLEATCARLVEVGVERVNAMVLSANEPGRRFYEHFGFEHVDEQETTVGGERHPESRYVLDRASMPGVE